MADDTSTLPIFRANFELFLNLSQLNPAHPEESRKLIEQHIERWSSFTKIVSADFEGGLDWFNVSRPLSLLKDLRGKIVVLDFFTYCCVNCQHVLPDLRELEKLYSVEDGLVVIGVHSPKFEHEKDSRGVLNAVLRSDINHPVVNDRDCKLWQMLFINCWPTLVVLGPEGQILFIMMGEGHRIGLLTSVSVAMDYFKKHDRISNHSLPMQLEKTRTVQTALSFPGKVCLSDDGSMLAIADSGHNRIILSTNSGVVTDIIGSGAEGFDNDTFQASTFRCPQGLAWHRDSIFVADSGNHVIRKIDLVSRTVTTLAGNNEMGSDEEGGGIGTAQPLNTPWDLCLVHSESASPDDPDVLLIALAGCHQIWMLCLRENVKWSKRESVFPAGLCMRAYGSGKEEHRNNLYGTKASFAQPSGLCFDKTNRLVYVADSESSSIRVISLENNSVKNVVGASRDPTDLFCFGDVDGAAGVVRLQHPMGVGYSHHKRTLYVADTYNHKIKAIDPHTRECKTVAGASSKGDAEGHPDHARFDEPSGLAVLDEADRTIIFVADTNNHCIKAVNSDGYVVKIPMVYRPGLSPNLGSKIGNQNSKDTFSRTATVINCSPIELSPNEIVTINLDIRTIHEEHTSVQLEWNFRSSGNTIQSLTVSLPSNPKESVTRGEQTNLSANPFLLLRRSAELADGLKEVTPLSLNFDFVLAFCMKKSGVCVPKYVRFVVPCRVVPVGSGKETSTVLELRHVITDLR